MDKLTSQDTIDNSKKQKKKQKLLAFKADLSLQTGDENSSNSNSTAILQINVVESRHEIDKLTATFSAIKQEFKNVTLLIDMHLSRLALAIVMPYMEKGKIDDMLEKMKDKWLMKNMPSMSSINMQWSLITNTESALEKSKSLCKIDEIIKNKKELSQLIEDDAKSLIKNLENKYGVDSQTHKHINMAETCIIDRLATLSAIKHIDEDTNYTYISCDKISAYAMLKNNCNFNLPSKHFLLTIRENKVGSLFLRKENINTFSYSKVLNEMARRNACLESFVKNFPGNFYMQSLDRTVLGCNKRQSLAFGITDEEHIVGHTFEDLFPKEDADKLADTVNKITSSNESKTIVEEFTFLGKKRTFLSVKTPLKNKNDNVIGIIGFSLAITDSNDPDQTKKSDTISEAQSIIENAVL